MDAQQLQAIVDTNIAPTPDPSDVSSPEAIVMAMYDVLSGPAEREQKRDWDRFRSLMFPGARFVLGSWLDEAGAEKDDVREWDIEGFIATAQRFYQELGFWERELWRRTERFGNVAHVFSTYESYAGDLEGEPAMRGINSIQVVRTRGRWWIVSTLWDVERSTNPIPGEYLTP